MPYTDAERTAAVEKLVRTSIRREYDSLGVRKTGTSFGDLKDAASGMFISRDGAPFYVALLARNRLVEFSTTVRESIVDLDRWAQAVGRHVSPVTRTRSLSNARVALDALAQATAQRTGTYQNIENIPAFLRFERNSGKFLGDESQKIVHRGDIIETPEQARELLRPGLRELRGQYDEVLRLAGLLENSIPDYTALNLPATLSQEVMTNASDVLQGRIDELDGMTAKDRLTVLKDVTLDVLTARSTVRGFGSLAPPTTFVQLEGTGGLYADDTHPATPAALEPYYDGGYIIDGEYNGFLDFVVDDAYTIKFYPVPGSFNASLDLLGTWTPPREIFSGTNEFRLIRRDGYGGLPYSADVVVTPGTYTPTQFMEEVNTYLGPSSSSQIGVVLKFTFPKTSQEVAISEVASPLFNYTAPAGVNFNDLGVVAGDIIFIEDDSSTGYRATAEVTYIVSDNVVQAATLSGTDPTDGETDILITIGQAGTEYPQILLQGPYNNIAFRKDLIIEDILEGTCANIGLAANAQARSARTPAASVAADLNVSAFTFVGGQARMDASVEFVPDYRIGTTQLRTHPENATALTMYLYRGQAEVQDVTGDNVQLVFLGELPDPYDDEFKAVIIREAPDPADIDNHGRVTNILTWANDAAYVELEGTTALQVGDIIEIEYGWNYALLYGDARYDFFIEVEQDIEQSGRFTVVGPSVSAVTDEPLPLEVLVDPGVPLYALPGNQPNFFEGTVGRDRVLFRSLSTGLDTKVQAYIDGDNPASAHYAFFVTDPIEAVGTTVWVLLPEVPARLEVGDQLEIHLTDPSNPDVVRTIDLIEEENLLIRLTEPVDTDLASSLNFTLDSPVPFARIRKQVKQNFDVMAKALEDWLDSKNALKTFRQLDAALNALLVNSNPSASSVGTFRTLLSDVTTDLEQLESILETYSASIVDEVDTLIKAFRAQGALRAVDILLSGDFQTFFSLDTDGSSYAGNVQRAIRDVQREDLPVRKDNRQTFDNLANDQIIAQFDDVDFERVAEDADPLDDLDIPELNDVLPGIPVP